MRLYKNIPSFTQQLVNDDVLLTGADWKELLAGLVSETILPSRFSLTAGSDFLRLEVEDRRVVKATSPKADVLVQKPSDIALVDDLVRVFVEGCDDGFTVAEEFIKGGFAHSEPAPHAPETGDAAHIGERLARMISERFPDQVLASVIVNEGEVTSETGHPAISADLGTLVALSCEYSSPEPGILIFGTVEDETPMSIAILAQENGLLFATSKVDINQVLTFFNEELRHLDFTSAATFH